MICFYGLRLVTTFFSTESRKFNVQIKVPVGELVKPATMYETEFLKQRGTVLTSNWISFYRMALGASPTHKLILIFKNAGKLSGMNENSGKVVLQNVLDSKEVCKRVLMVTNVSRVPSTDDMIFRYIQRTCRLQNCAYSY